MMTPGTRGSAPEELPPAARWADGAAAVLAAAALWILATGGARYLVGDVVVSFRSPALAFYLAASLVVVRHLMWPRPSLPERVRRGRESLRRRPALEAALRAFLATRPAVLLIGFLAVVTFGITTPGFVLSPRPLENLPARFDAGWYGGIAVEGYSWDRTFQRQQNIAFFPAFPMMMRAVGAPLGAHARDVTEERRMIRALWAGVLVSLAAFFWALHYFVRLGRDLAGPEAAVSAALLLAAYPFSVFFSAPYTESLYLLSAVAAFYHFRRGDWTAASGWGLLLGLTRPNGCFASVPLALLGLQQLRALNAAGAETDAGSGTAVRQAPLVRAAAVRLLVAAMPGLGMLLFTLYLQQMTGVWFAWSRSHEAWGRAYHGLAPFATAYGWLAESSIVEVVTNVPYNSLNTIGLIFALVLTVPVFRRLGLPWGVFVLINLLPPLFAGGVLSMGRLTSTLFPLFLGLALVVPARSVPAWCVAFGLGQGFAAALFFTWRELF